MSTTVHFGSNTTEFSLASAPVISSGVVSFEITASSTVTAETVAAALSGVESYTLTTDGAVGAEQDNYELYGNVAIDAGTSNIVFAMRQKTADEIQKAQMQEQIDALGAQVAALTLGGATA